MIRFCVSFQRHGCQPDASISTVQQIFLRTPLFWTVSEYATAVRRNGRLVGRRYIGSYRVETTVVLGVRLVKSDLPGPEAGEN